MAKPNTPFLKTNDPDTKNKLLKEGFQLISEENGFWTFLNDPKKSTKAFAKKDLVYSSQLEF